MKKLNNKGFSLVELIIVIAIMAILVGVVGTQVIPYLENSRKAKDTQIFSAWNTAAVSAYSTEAGNVDANKTYKIEIKKSSGGITVNAYNASGTADADNKGETAIKKTFCALTDLDPAVGYDYGSLASKAGKDVTSVLITINGGNGEVVTTVSNSSSKYSFDPIENK